MIIVNKKGRISIRAYSFSSLSMAINSIEGLDVLKVSSVFSSGKTIIIATHEDFRPVKPGSKIPEYRLVLRDGNNQKWIEVI